MSHDGAPDNGSRAVIIAAVIGAVATVLGSLFSYLGGVQKGQNDNTSAATVTVRSTVTETAAAANTDQGDGSSAAVSGAAGANDARITPMILPLPVSHLDYTGVDIGPPDATGGGGSDFYYQRDENDDAPTVRWHSTGSINVTSKNIDRNGCLTALRTAPAGTPLRDLHAGTLFCVGDESGRGNMALFEVTQAPGRDGTMKVTEHFWPGSS